MNNTIRGQNMFVLLYSSVQSSEEEFEMI